MITLTKIDEEQAWRQLTARDAEAAFFYGVTTTGVFCRPGCSSRVPLRSNARFFESALEAKENGFRACRRCKPEEPRADSAVKRMCVFLEEQTQKFDRPVRLEELGKAVGMSLFSAQRLFKKEMGVTPAQYQRALRANAFRTELRKQETSVTTAIYGAGYGSSSRAYAKTPLGMTPGRFLAGGRGETIRFATVRCEEADAALAKLNLGWIVVGSTERGICWLALGDSAEAAEESLRTEFPLATMVAEEELKKSIGRIVQDLVPSKKSASGRNDLPLDLRGTAFQLRVWQALQKIPAGETRSYSQLAAEMGMPAATRAVARACALNRVSVLVPCHRVVGVSGSLTGYRWGVERKRQLLAVERGR